MTIRRQREIHYWVIGDDENFIVFFVLSTQIDLFISWIEGGLQHRVGGGCHPLLYMLIITYVALRQLINND